MKQEISTANIAWIEKIREQHESGLTIKIWCQKNDIHPSTFHYWKKKFSSETTMKRSSFIELKERKEAGVTIEYNGFHIQLAAYFDPTILQKCLAALRGL